MFLLQDHYKENLVGCLFCNFGTLPVCASTFQNEGERYCIQKRFPTLDAPHLFNCDSPYLKHLKTKNPKNNWMLTLPWMDGILWITIHLRCKGKRFCGTTSLRSSNWTNGEDRCKTWRGPIKVCIAWRIAGCQWFLLDVFDIKDPEFYLTSTAHVKAALCIIKKKLQKQRSPKIRHDNIWWMVSLSSKHHWRWKIPACRLTKMDPNVKTDNKRLNGWFGDSVFLTAVAMTLAARKCVICKWSVSVMTVMRLHLNRLHAQTTPENLPKGISRTQTLLSLVSMKTEHIS